MSESARSEQNGCYYGKPLKTHWLHQRYRQYKTKHYGGVSEEWRDYRAFVEWCARWRLRREDVIARLDAHKPWGPQNCTVLRGEKIHWYYSAHNARKRNDRPVNNGNLEVEIGGVCMPVRQWCKVIGLNWTTYKDRVQRGWPVSTALLAPVKPYAKTEAFNQERERRYAEAKTRGGPGMTQGGGFKR